MWYLIMDECHGVYLNAVVDSMSSLELRDIADRPVSFQRDVLIYEYGDRKSMTAQTRVLTALTPEPPVPPHAFLSSFERHMKEHLGYYRDMISVDKNS